jgi:molecular chaperone DnaK
MYKAGSTAPTDGGAAAAGTADTNAGQAAHDEGVIDAEYVDVDKK